MKNKLISGKWYSVFDENGNASESFYDEDYRRMLGFETEAEYASDQDSWWNGIHPDDRERLSAYLDECMKKQPEGMNFDIEYRMMTKRGYRWFHDFGHCTRRPDGSPARFDGIVFDMQDIKDQEFEQRHDALRKEILDYVINHYDEDPVELLLQFGEKIRELLDCDQFIFRDLEQTRMMVNSAAIEKTWSVPESYCRQCQHFDAHHPMYAGGYTEMDNCQKGWQGIPVYEKCPIKSSLTRIVYCNGEVAGYVAIHYIQKYHQFTELERMTLEEFVRNLSLVLSRYEARKEASKVEGVKRMMNMIFSLSDEFDPIMVLDPQTGEYDWYMSLTDDVSANTSMKSHGDDFYRNIGIDSASIIHEDDRAQFQAFYTRENMMEIATTGQPREIENRWFIQTEGAYKWKYNKAVRMVDDSGKAYVVIGVIDTTERRRNDEIVKALTENNQRIMALEDNFESLYEVELESGRYVGYVKGDFYQSNVADKLLPPGDYFEDLRANIDAVIYPEDRDALFNVLDRESIRKALAENERIEHFYRMYVGNIALWFKIRVVYKDKEQRNVIIGCYNAEDEVTERQRMEQTAKRNAELVEAYSRQYSAVYYGNLDDGSYKILVRKEAVVSIIKGNDTICDAFRAFAEKTVHPSDIGLFRENCYSLESLKAVLAEEDTFSFEYRSNTYGDYRWFKVFMRKINGTDIIVGFKDCDDEVTERLVHDKLINEYDALYVLDLNRNELRPARQSRVTKIGVIEGKTPYDKVARQFAAVVAPQYRDEWERLSDVGYIKRYLAGEDHREYLYELPSTEKTLRRLSFDVLSREGGEASTVLMSFVGIDDTTAKTMMLQKEIAERTVFTSYFFEPYESAYYIDLEDLSWKVYKRSDILEHNYPSGEDYVESLGRYIETEVHPDDREALSFLTRPAELKERLSRTPHIAFNFRNIDRDSVRILHCEAIVGEDENHMALGFRDVTAEYTAEQEQQMKMKKALDEAREANLRNDTLHHLTKSGQWTYGIDVNDEVVSAEYEDIAVLDVIGQYSSTHPMSWVDLLHPDDRERVLGEFWAAIRDHSGNTPYDTTFRVLNADGNYRWAKSAGRLLRHTDGSAELYGMNIDITDQMEKEHEQQQQLEEALAMAQSANRAKTTFLNNMSHDIRTPMNAIIGYTGLAASHIDNREQVKDYLGKISQSSNHLLSLINDVLDMSRIESGKMNLDEKEENLSEVIHTLKDIVQADIHSKQLDFYVDAVDVNDENVICDKLRLNQVLLNILSNAIKYTPAGGTVTMRVEEKAVKNSGYATFEFRIKDNGMGMDKQFLQTIFDPFTRVKPSTVSGIQGTGLGMAITKNIVDMMGGKIDIQSEPCKGTEVTVEFDFKLQSVPKGPVQIPEFKELRALVVDDDSNTCLSICGMLEDIGMRDEWCTSGKEAVIRAQAAFRKGDLFKVYIIDWLMPDMNGIETTRRIRKVIGDDVPIIILTAYDWSDIEEEAREAGVTAFVSKPMFPSDLHRVLTSCLDSYEQQEDKPADDFDINGKKILLVEDNDLNREIATALLEEYGCIVKPAENGEIAVSMMKFASPGEFDLVLMDIQMPTIDGYEATRQIRALGTEISRIPILAMTANAFEEDRKAALAAGMDEHIAKPIDIENLKETLARFLQ